MSIRDSLEWEYYKNLTFPQDFKYIKVEDLKRMDKVKATSLNIQDILNTNDFTGLEQLEIIRSVVVGLNFEGVDQAEIGFIEDNLRRIVNKSLTNTKA